MLLKINFAVLLGILLSACSYSGIKPIGKDTYMEARERSGFSSGGECLADLYEDANEFCTDKGLTLVTVHETHRDGIPGRELASAILNFRCVPQGDIEDQRPVLNQNPNVIINNIGAR